MATPVAPLPGPASPPPPSPPSSYRALALPLILAAQCGFARDVAPAAALCRESWGDADLWAHLVRCRGPARGGATPLHCAAAAASTPDRVAFLLSCGTTIDAPDAEGATPLLHAARSRHEATALGLLKAGAKPTIAHLAAAAGSGHAALVDALLAAGVSPHGEPGAWLPLHAAAAGGHVGIIGLLLRAGAPVDATAPDPYHRGPRTPLELSLLSRCEEAALALLTAGATAAEPLASSPHHLDLAAEWAGGNLIARLVAAGAQPNRADTDGRIALHTAAEAGNLAAVQALLKARASVDFPLVSLPEIRAHPLLLAAAGGHAGVVAALADAGASLFSGGIMHGEATSALHAAAKSGHDDVVFLLLSRGVLRDIKSMSSGPSDPLSAALLAAATRGHHTIVVALLGAAAGAGLRVSGEGALYAAAARGHSGVVAALLSSDRDGWEGIPYALAAASFHGHHDLATTLLARCPDADDDEVYRVLLLTASAGGCVGVMSAMLSRGADPNCRVVNPFDQREVTPLVLACENKRVDAAELLLRHGADPCKPVAPGGIAPMHAAAHACCEPLVRALLKAGAPCDTYARDDRRYATPLWFAASAGSVAAVTALLCAGADPNAPCACDSELSTPFLASFAPAMVGDRMLNTMLEHGASARARLPGSGSSPLHWAACCGYLDTVTTLLARGADVNGWERRDIGHHRHAFTPLMSCVEADCDLGVAAALLDAGADPTAEGFSQGQPASPLTMAAQWGKGEMLALLLKRGADVNRAVTGGSTALHVAAAHGQAQACRALLAAGANPAAVDDEGRTPADVAARARGDLLAARLREAAAAVAAAATVPAAAARAS